ncbi:2S sulfur-rich seed storage protein large chain 2 like protein [Tanacetum coccineum]|uniref:2S sulfur-rich seed storage protein large chain 2 like protein n=1 Tax=Tanacetum coccineum TaxID=301880 RepID=A0ABQ5IB89_9ASTR
MRTSLSASKPERIALSKWSNKRCSTTAGCTSPAVKSPRAFMNPAEEHMKLCCKQLENMGEMCMCEGIKMMMNMQGWTQQQQMGQMVAENLPKMCGLMTQSCQMRAVWF